jgi:uncharacterized membrane protein
MKRITPMALAAGAALAAMPAVLKVKQLRGRGSRGTGSFAFAPTHVSQRWFFGADREHVFSYWTEFASFPDYFDGVQTVLALGKNHFLFELMAPAGGRIFWEAVLTRLVPGREIAWSSDPYSSVQCRGRALFFSKGGEGGPPGTVVEIEAEYGPGPVWIAERMERFLALELPGLLGRDLVRMKNLIETGSADL